MKNIIVIKLGGIAIENLNDAFIQQIKAWHLENKKIIIVHGGCLLYTSDAADE